MASNHVHIVCISDIHNNNLTGKVPDGDILLHARDMTDNGTYDELSKALGWIRKLPRKLKLSIPGTRIFLPRRESIWIILTGYCDRKS